MKPIHSRINRVGLFLATASFGINCHAATKGGTDATTQEAALKPPHEILVPGFFEQHFWPIIIISSIFGIQFIWILFMLLRPRRVAPEAPIVLARRELIALQEKADTGAVIVKISHCLKQYINTRLGFMPGQKTTAEFTALLQRQTQIPQELANELILFLRVCDELKFSPSPRTAGGGMNQRASQLLEQVEAHCVQQEAPAPAGGSKS